MAIEFVEQANTDEIKVLPTAPEEEAVRDPDHKANELNGFFPKPDLDAAPTFTPKSFNEQIQFFNGLLYFFANGQWNVGGAQFKMGTGLRNSATGAGDQTFTCGFRPKMIIFFSALDDDSYTANSSFCVGAYTVADENENIRFYYDAANTKWRGQKNSEYIVNMLGATNASITALSATGFTLTWNPVNEDTIYLYIAFT
jgi:hypothetical protein